MLSRTFKASLNVLCSLTLFQWVQGMWTYEGLHNFWLVSLLSWQDQHLHSAPDICLLWNNPLGMTLKLDPLKPFKFKELTCLRYLAWYNCLRNFSNEFIFTMSDASSDVWLQLKGIIPTSLGCLWVDYLYPKISPQLFNFWFCCIWLWVNESVCCKWHGSSWSFLSNSLCTISLGLLHIIVSDTLSCRKSNNSTLCVSLFSLFGNECDHPKLSENSSANNLSLLMLHASLLYWNWQWFVLA